MALFGIVGVFLGLALGVVAGVWGGTALFAKYFEQLDVSRFDIKSDYDDSVPVPRKQQDKPVPRRFRAFLPYLPNWATVPDFHRVTWANHVLRTLWPYYNQAIGKMVLETVKPQIDAVVRQYPFLEAIDVELIDFGTRPLRVAGVKVYSGVDDEVICEAPLAWGSNASVRVAARLRAGRFAFYVPLELCDFQMKATARATLRPLVDTLPCMGAVTISLTEDPYLDFSLHLFSAFDLMLLPGVREAALWAIKGVVGDMIVYPNKMTFDIMEGGGVPPPPIGLLQIKLEGVDSISAGGDLLSKVDPYVELGVREDRHQRTKTAWNNKHPTYNEVFNLIVDDIDSQTLSFKLHDDDMGFNDPVIGVAECDLADAQFIANPRQRTAMELDFLSVPALKKIKRLVRKSSAHPQRQPTESTDAEGRKVYKIPDAPEAMRVLDEGEHAKKKGRVGRLRFEAIYVPFADAAEPDPTQPAEAEPNKLASTGFSRITDDDKGILTVTLRGCTNLASSDSEVDPYVTLEVNDPQRAAPERQVSTSMHNEPNPHYNQKFDFAMVSATSQLVLRVWDKKSTLQNMLHNPVKMIAGKLRGKTVERDECIGSLRLKVRDVVRNERIKDAWALQETQKGDAHLTLEWRPITLQDCPDLLPAGDLAEEEQHQKQLQQEREEAEAEAAGEPSPKDRKRGSKDGGHSHLHLPHFHLHKPHLHKHERPEKKVEYEQQQ